MTKEMNVEEKSGEEDTEKDRCRHNIENDTKKSGVAK